MNYIVVIVIVVCALTCFAGILAGAYSEQVTDFLDARTERKLRTLQALTDYENAKAARIAAEQTALDANYERAIQEHTRMMELTKL